MFGKFVFGKLAMAEMVFLITIAFIVYFVYKLIKFIKRKIG